LNDGGNWIIGRKSRKKILKCKIFMMNSIVSFIVRKIECIMTTN